MQTLHSVYAGPIGGCGVDEPCVRRTDGNFVGVKTGREYPGDTHYSRPRRLAILTGPLISENRTGMVHLEDEDRRRRRHKFKGCIVAVEEAHFCGVHTVYYSPDLQEYFADVELELCAE